MGIDITSGELLNSALPIVTATLSANTTLTTGQTVVYNTELLDTGNNYNNATGLFTAPITGKYMVMLSGAVTVNAGGGFMQFNINDIAASKSYPVVGDGNNSFNNAITTASAGGGMILSLAAGATVNVTVTITSFTTFQLLGTSGGVVNCWLSIFQVA